MSFADRNRIFLAKLRSLPDNKKKIIMFFISNLPGKITNWKQSYGYIIEIYKIKSIVPRYNRRILLRYGEIVLLKYFDLLNAGKKQDPLFGQSE